MRSTQLIGIFDFGLPLFDCSGELNDFAVQLAKSPAPAHIEMNRSETGPTRKRLGPRTNNYSETVPTRKRLGPRTNNSSETGIYSRTARQTARQDSSSAPSSASGTMLGPSEIASPGFGCVSMNSPSAPAASAAFASGATNSR